MKKYSGILSVFFSLLLAATLGCNDDDDVIPQDVLIAIAGNDLSSNVGENILLDGSASYSKDSKPFEYTWSIKSKPQGSTATIQGLSTTKPTFTPDQAGVYVIQLLLTRDNLSAKDELKLTVAADSPIQTIILSEDITENTILEDIMDDPSQPDYRVTHDISVRGDLIIKPGVIIAFESNKGMEIVTGSIQAKGLETNGIVFKGALEQPAYWKGLVIHTNSEVNELTYVTIKQGGSEAFMSTNTQANVTLAGNDHSGAAVKITHSHLNESGAHGLYVQGKSSLNAFANNSFKDNAWATAYIPAEQIHKIDLGSFSDGNGGFLTIETGGGVSLQQEVSWKRLPYLVTSDIKIQSGVKIDAGANFRFEPALTMAVTDNGYLQAAGSETANIIFTSAGDNAYWNGLYINSFSEKNTIMFSEISGAGANRISDADHEANVVVGQNGLLKLENSVITKGKGYGVVTKTLNNVNANVASSNIFNNLQKGTIFPVPINNLPAITGVWLDQWSFNQGANVISSNFYDRVGGTWFEGASNPWAMEPAAFGIRIDENGDFVWTIAEHSPMTGCESFSTEYITGKAIITDASVAFEQQYWRSKFVNKCDASQNVDTEVTPVSISLPYTITKTYNMWTGEECWMLKFTNPDQSTFTFYRR